MTDVKVYKRVENDRTIYFLDDMSYHREDGPAVEWSNGIQMWYQFDKLHRVDGPAVVGPYSDAYFVDGHNLSEKEFNDWRQWYDSDPSNSDYPWEWGLSLVGVI